MKMPTTCPRCQSLFDEIIHYYNDYCYYKKASCIKCYIDNNQIVFISKNSPTKDHINNEVHSIFLGLKISKNIDDQGIIFVIGQIIYIYQNNGGSYNIPYFEPDLSDLPRLIKKINIYKIML